MVEISRKPGIKMKERCIRFLPKDSISKHRSQRPLQGPCASRAPQNRRGGAPIWFAYLRRAKGLDLLLLYAYCRRFLCSLAKGSEKSAKQKARVKSRFQTRPDWCSHNCRAWS